MYSLIRKIAVGASLFALILHTASAELLLTYAVTTEKTTVDPQGKEPAKTDKSEYTLTILLDETTIAIQRDSRERLVYDFAGERLQRIDLKAGTVRDTRICSVIDSLDAELHNRTMLSTVMAKAKIDTQAAALDPFFYESELRIALRGAPPQPIETVRDGDVIEFKHQGKSVVRFVPDRQAVPEALRHRFVNALAYTQSFHPQIRAAIAETGFIPAELTIHSNQMGGTQITTAKLLSSGTSGLAAFTQAAVGLKPAPAGDTPFDQLMASIHSAMLSGQPDTPEQAIAFANQAIAEKRPLDALMALIEHGLQTGKQLGDELKRHRSTFNADADCRTYIEAFAQNSKETVEKSIKLNASLDRTKYKKAHMLELQRANLVERLGRPREAIEGYFTVLRANPFHAGALHDLGMVYARSFEHPMAWVCWDTALRLAPDHPLMGDVKARAAMLRQTYPDFF